MTITGRRTVVKVYVVRHGETEENRLGIIQGQLDTALNENGQRQAMAVADALRDIPFEKAYTSDLGRASETAEIILQHHPGLDLVKDEALRERYMGELQGLSVWDNALAPLAESPGQFSQRAMRWWGAKIERHVQSVCGKRRARALRDDAQPPREDVSHMLVVSHGGLIDVLLRELLGCRKIDLAKGVEVGRYLNTGVSVLELGERGGTLVRYADVSHLTALEEEAVETNADVV